MTQVRLYRLASGAGFKVTDSHGRALAYIYGAANRSTAQLATTLSLAEAEAIAKFIARALAAQPPSHQGDP